ncbi:MAG: helix-turn-helix domain-containing protein [Microvirga sp.]
MNGHVYYRKGEPKLSRPFHYADSGLPDIWLANGVTHHDEGEYGSSYAIADLEALHGLIAAHIVLRTDGLMTGPELRFLRKRMRRSQAEIAALIHITEQSIANYEKGATPVPGPVDFSMRALFAFEILPGEAAITVMRVLGNRLPWGDAPARPDEFPGLPSSAWAEAA